MTIVILGLVLLGSFSTAGLMLVQGMPWWMVAAGYVAGGWAAALTGFAVFALAALLIRRPTLSLMIPAKD